jgi:hypothetical protein
MLFNFAEDFAESKAKIVSLRNLEHFVKLLVHLNYRPYTSTSIQLPMVQKGSISGETRKRSISVRLFGAMPICPFQVCLTDPT